MSGVSSSGIYLPGPDQSSTVGAVYVAPVGTTMPTDARTALPSTWESGGYVGEDGLQLGLSYGVTTIRDWSKGAVRNALESFDGTATVPFLQIDEWSAKRLVGNANVTVTAASSSAGNVTKIALGAHLPDPEAYVFNMKDGNRRVRVVLPNAQITAIDNLTFVPNEANTWTGTLTCSQDASGNSIYVIYDDGEVVTAGNPI